MEGNQISCVIDECCSNLEEDSCPLNKDEESGYFSGALPSLQSGLKDKSFDPSGELQCYPHCPLPGPQITPDSPGISQPLQSLQLSQRQFIDKNQDWLESGIKVLKEPEESALHTAIWQNQSERADALIRSSSRDALNIPNSKLQTPLHVAALQRMVVTVILLVQKGADLNQVDNNGDTMLHIVSREGFIDILQEIIGIADKTTVLHCLETRNYHGHACLHLAASFGHLDIVRLLAKTGVNVNVKDGAYNYTILHYAVQKRDLNLLECVLSLEQISLDETSYSGESALQLAEKLRYNDVIKYLRQHPQYQ